MARTKIAAPKKASSTKKASSDSAKTPAKKTTAKKKTAAKKKQATAAADKAETAQTLATLAGKLSGSAQTLADFKKNPAAAIGSLLSGTDASDDTVQSIEEAVEPHGEGADMTSLLGSLAGLLGNDVEEAEAEDQAQGGPLEMLAGLLGVGGSGNDDGGNTSLETIGNVISIVSALAPVFGSLGNDGSSSSKKKKSSKKKTTSKKKKTSTASTVLDLLGKFLG